MLTVPIFLAVALQNESAKRLSTEATETLTKATMTKLTPKTTLSKNALVMQLVTQPVPQKVRNTVNTVKTAMNNTTQDKKKQK